MLAHCFSFIICFCEIVSFFIQSLYFAWKAPTKRKGYWRLHNVSAIILKHWQATNNKLTKVQNYLTFFIRMATLFSFCSDVTFACIAAAIYAPCILLLKNIDVIGKEKDGTTEGIWKQIWI